MKPLRIWGGLGLALVLYGTSAAPSVVRAQAAQDPVQGPAQPAGAQAGGGTVATANPAPAPGPAAPPADSGAYVVRLRSLERNINELKEQVFRTKLRLNVLKETVLGGVIGASRGIIHHKNEMSNSYRLIKAVYALDGVQIFSKVDESERLSEQGEFEVYNGAIQPGSHTLTVQLVYQGNGFGVFSYLKGYKFNVRSSHTFVAAEGKSTAVTAVGYEKGSIATNMEDKPALEFRVNVISPQGATTAGSGK